MNIEAELKKDGIEVVNRLDTLSVNSIARSVAEKICKAFPRAHFVYDSLFIEFSRIPMYIAKMPDGFAEANYFYKNSSIYFKAGTPLDELEKYAIHEILHFVQEVKDSKGILYRLGLCEYGEFNTYGMALNEGAVQLATSKILGSSEEIVKYYDISLPTNSPNCYPLLCNLVNQMAYLFGKDVLFESTLFSTDEFKVKCLNSFGKKNFMKIQEKLDSLLNIEEKIVLLNNELMSEDCKDSRALKISSKILQCKDSIKNTFIETQNLIFTSYFNNEFSKIKTTQEIEFFRTKLYNYKNYIGITENYNIFNNFYIDKMIALEAIFESITNNVALVVVKENIFTKFFAKLHALFSANKEQV